MYGSKFSWTPVIVVFFLLSAIIGWLVIEALIWLFSHLSISFV